MNRKDGGKEGRTREGALSWSPEENFRERGQGGGRQGWRQGEGRQGWRQGGTGAGRNGGREEAIFGVFWGNKRKKEG